MRIIGRIAEHARTQGQTTALPPQDQGGDTRRVARILYANDRAMTRGRGGQSLIHASSLSRLPPCARIHALLKEMREAGVTFSETPMGSMKLVWSYGRAAEKHVRENLLMDDDMRRDAYGVWKCRCGHTKTTGHHEPTAKACPKCGRKPSNYHEIAMFDKPYALVGNPDFLFLDGPRYRVIEIKSLKPTTTSTIGFDTIQRAFPEHIEQACHYVRLGMRNGLKMHRTPLILYVNKGFDMRNWYKPFYPTDSELTRAEDNVNEHREVTSLFKSELDARRVPDMIPACKDDMEHHKKRCPVWAECASRRNAA